MPSHTREDLAILSRRKAVGLIAEALISTKDMTGIHHTTHERALAMANFLELQSASDKLALLSLFSLSPPPQACVPMTIAGKEERQLEVGASNAEKLADLNY